MALYLIQASYTADTLATLVKNPQDRLPTVSEALGKLGGNLLCGGMCFGDFDIAVIADLPDNTAAAAFSFAIAAGGACTKFKTTLLLSPEEATTAMKNAASLGYKPPATGYRSKV